MWEVSLEDRGNCVFTDIGDLAGSLASGLDALTSRTDATTGRHFRELAERANPVRLFFIASERFLLVLRKFA